MIQTSVAGSDPRFSTLQHEYLAGLATPHDIYTAAQIRIATPHLILNEGVAVGHFAIDDDATLLAFHVPDERLARRAFEYILEAHGVFAALVQTFEPLFLSLALDYARHVKTTTLHFTRDADPHFTPDPAIISRLANARDGDAVMAINDNFFTWFDEADRFIHKKEMYIYEDEDGLLGCGLIQSLMAGRDVRDIGMLVARSRRGEGHGEYIVRHLKAHCLANGLRSTARCDFSNYASRACLEAAGFRSQHRSLKVIFF